MPLIILALIIYVVIVEWRSVVQRKNLADCRRLVDKLQGDKTIWYSGVLPKSGELCLFQEADGDYVIAKLSDKRWLKKDGNVDFAKIKRWLYIGDLDK